MALTLVLIRHCKSDWDAGIASDHARPLNARGTRDAPRIGAWLSAQGIAPDTVLCSDATRTRQTWAGMAPHLPAQSSLTLSPALYLAEPEAMLRAVHQTRGQTTALIAHNPGIASLAWALAKTPSDDPAFEAYPTGATTILTFDVSDWANITLGQGTITAFTTPRDLPDPA